MCRMGVGGVAGRVSSSKACCSSSVHSKDGVMESLCSQKVLKLTVSISGNRSKENLSPSLGGVSRECGGVPPPAFPAVLPYKYLGQGSPGGVLGRPVLLGGGWSVLGLRPGDRSDTSSSSFFWACSSLPSERPCGLPGSAHWGPLDLKVRWRLLCWWQLWFPWPYPGFRGTGRLWTLGSPGALKSLYLSLPLCCLLLEEAF